MTQEIQFHYDHGSDAHPAIDVKINGSLFYRMQAVECDDEDIREQAYDRMAEDWWRLAKQVAHRHGYSGVFSEGRSDGWLVPYKQYQHGKLMVFQRWPGQGPDLGYPQYPDVMNDEAEREQFLTFQKEILELLDQAPVMYAEEVRDLLEEQE